MKRKILIGAGIFFMALSFNSCENTCKICKKVYYDSSGSYIREDGEAEYCGAELLAIDGRTINLGALGSAKWECD